MPEEQNSSSNSANVTQNSSFGGDAIDSSVQVGDGGATGVDGSTNYSSGPAEKLYSDQQAASAAQSEANIATNDVVTPEASPVDVAIAGVSEASGFAAGESEVTVAAKEALTQGVEKAADDAERTVVAPDDIEESGVPDATVPDATVQTSGGEGDGGTSPEAGSGGSGGGDDDSGGSSGGDDGSGGGDDGSGGSSGGDDPSGGGDDGSGGGDDGSGGGDGPSGGGDSGETPADDGRGGGSGSEGGESGRAGGLGGTAARQTVGSFVDGADEAGLGVTVSQHGGGARQNINVDPASREALRPGTDTGDPAEKPNPESNGGGNPHSFGGAQGARE